LPVVPHAVGSGDKGGECRLCQQPGDRHVQARVFSSCSVLPTVCGPLVTPPRVCLSRSGKAVTGPGSDGPERARARRDVRGLRP
jgi:hypothetical protein